MLKRRSIILTTQSHFILLQGIQFKNANENVLFLPIYKMLICLVNIENMSMSSVLVSRRHRNPCLQCHLVEYQGICALVTY